MAEIQSRQRAGKPKCSSTSSKQKGHDTVSKALARSTLSSMEGLRSITAVIIVIYQLLFYGSCLF